MSSRGSQVDRPGCLVGLQAAEDLVADAAAEGADGLGPTVAGGQPVIEVRPAWTAQPELGDGDPVEGDVELAVAPAVETVTDDVARPDGDRCGAVVQGEGRLRPEAADAGGLADDLGRRQGPAAGQRQEGRRQLRRRVGSISRSRSRMAWLSSMIRASRSRAKRATGSVRSASAAPSAAWTAARPSERGPGSGTAELDEEPAQALLVTGPLADEVLAMVDEQAHLALGAVEARRPAGPAHAGRRGPRPGRRSGRSCPAPARSGGHRPSAWASTRTTASPARTSSASSRRRQVPAVLEAPRPLRPLRPPSDAARGGPRRSRRSSSRRAGGRSRRSRPRCDSACANPHPGRPCPCLLLVRGDDGPVGGHT